MDKTIGDKVFGASINKNGSLKIKAVAVGKDTMISKIIKLVENAQSVVLKLLQLVKYHPLLNFLQI